MAVDQEILDLLRGRELSIKDLALAIDRSPASLYKPMAKLVRDGLVRKTQRLVKGKPVFYYSVPSVVGVEGCQWESYKAILATSKIFRKNVLDVDFWPFLKQQILSLEERKETLDVAFTGLKGLGKSVSAIWLACWLDGSFSVRGNIILRKEQLLELGIDQPTDRAFVLDDLGTSLSSRGWAERERSVVFSFFEICRQNRVHLLGTSPSLDLVDVNFRRLIRYVFDLQMRCKDHTHTVIYRVLNPGSAKFVLEPVGTLTLPYPNSIDGLIKEYEALKRQELRGAAQDALERLERAKEGVARYIFSHPVTRVTSDVVGAALDSLGLNGDVPKQDRDRLRVQMYNTLEEKKKAEKKAKRQQIEQGKENLKKARLSASYRSKRQAYIDKGRSEVFSKTLAFRLTFEKSRAGNLKNLPGAMGSLLKRGVKPYLVENLVLARLDDVYLVRDLRGMRDILAFFKSFDESFYSKLFAWFLEAPKEALSFIRQAKEMRKSFLYQYHKRFSPKKWREAVLWRLNDLEAKERWKRQQDRNLEGGIAAVIDLGYLLFKKQNPKLLDYVEQKDRSFWGDV